MDNKQKEFLDLLQEYKSDDTKKARRNASFIAFVIISAWVLGIRVIDIRFLGMDISATKELYVLWLVAVILVYWTAMFLIAWTHDKEIQKERSWFLQGEIARLRERMKEIERLQAEHRRDTWTDRHEVQNALAMYDAQVARTKRAAALGAIIENLELFVPLILSAAAAIILGRGIAASLT